MCLKPWLLNKEFPPGPLQFCLLMSFRGHAQWTGFCPHVHAYSLSW